MGWVKISEELYSSDQSNFSLEKIDGIWYVIDNSRQAKSIPFTDIFNNPVFPVDFSNVDLIVKNLVAIEDVSGVDAFFTNRVFAKHFRAESANTPNTQGFSFQSDIDTGLYNISSDKIGFSAGGSRQGEFGIGYGGFTGNIIQVVNSENTYNQTTSNNANWSTDVLSAVGTTWEIPITPKYTNSKIKIQLCLSSVISKSATSAYFGISIWRKIGAGSYIQIQIPQVDNNGSYEFGVNGGSSSGLYLNALKLFIDSPNSSSIVTYKFSVRTYSSSDTLNINPNATLSTGKSYCVIEEIQQ